MDLTRHSVFITSGTRGIGFELAKALVARGSKVAVCGRSADGLTGVRERLPAVTPLQCDLSDIDALPAFVDRLRSAFGSPTILVNNAASSSITPGWTRVPRPSSRDSGRKSRSTSRAPSP
jgi:NAD(P)-dependent dehydrogenase (short-subunit alcohol dehydrogenase family)